VRAAVPAPNAPNGMRAGGEGVFLTNLGVLVTHVRLLFPPRRCRAAELCADASPFRPRLGTETQQLRLGPSALTRGPAAPAAELLPAATTCAPGWHSAAVLLPAPAVRRGKNRLTTVKTPSREGVVSHQWLHLWREKQWGEDDVDAPKTLHCRLTQHGHNLRQCLRHAGSGREEA
jgi:hypothetical protein